MAEHNDFGKLGEELAVNYLIGKGYEILERNWRNQHKEIDIIAKDGKDLVVVEVKARQTDEYGGPDEAVTQQKRSRLVEAANASVCAKRGICGGVFQCINHVDYFVDKKTRK